MFTRRLKHMLLRLGVEERVIGLGALAVLASLFMPWYSMVLNFEKGVTESGFSGDLGVVGFVAFLLMALALLFLVADPLHIRMPKFGFAKESILLFLSGESAFVLLLVAAIYTKRSLGYTNAEIRFGLYVALIGAILASFAALMQIQKKERKSTEAFFGYEEEEEGVETEKGAEEAHQRPEHHARSHARHSETKRAAPHHAPKQESLLAEQEPALPGHERQESLEEPHHPSVLAQPAEEKRLPHQEPPLLGGQEATPSSEEEEGKPPSAGNPGGRFYQDL